MVEAGLAGGAPCANNGGEPRTAGSMPVACRADTSAVAAANNAQSAKDGGKSHGGFIDFILGVLDVINPLQHIPVISTLYRHLTGDEISPMAQVAGDTLYGGPIGAAFSMANLAVKADTGEDVGDHVLAMVTGKTSPATPAEKTVPAVQVATAGNGAGKNAVPVLSEAQLTTLLSKNAPVHTPAPRAVPAAVDMQPQNAFQKKYFHFRHAPAAATPVQTPARPPARAPVQTHSAAHALLAAQENRAVETLPSAQTVPHGQIAARMMDGLDKYAAMQKIDMARTGAVPMAQTGAVPIY